MNKTKLVILFIFLIVILSITFFMIFSYKKGEKNVSNVQYYENTQQNDVNVGENLDYDSKLKGLIDESEEDIVLDENKE